MYHNKRFQTDIDFPFVAFSHEQMKTSCTQGFLMVDQARFGEMSERILNIDWNIMNALTERMEKDEYVRPDTLEEKRCFQIIQDLDAMSGKMHGSIAGKKIMRNEIWSLIARIGSPCWYLTLSPADNRHPLCIYFAGSEEKFNPIPLPYAERARLVCNNPVAGARFFDFMVRTCIEDVLGFGTDNPGVYGHTSGYYRTAYRIFGELPLGGIYDR
ncbi:hypothetical protein CPB83DRAFT_866637 [Crepidotus variabilis]|uniref:Helitron helicase-like domain-containing protein n=1 Tax=Crepidotus variabilis TaxID=179855 RepID=A0A9P6ET39_9AGAR|nr:hypothetical protein CPB83DRAFT_866637 [Crepidotus variabilis]